ncbi:MAG: hypothetical protein K0R85_1397 [Devosia sp.]|jgi:hypothetical protein|nr:hypothetical protein [Devosia sp.]
MVPKHLHARCLPNLAAAMNCEGPNPPPRAAVQRPPHAFRRSVLQPLLRG